MYSLRLENIQKNYESQSSVFSLHIEQLAIQRGEFFGIVGSSGCGKTTLLKIIAGLCDQDMGKVYMNEQDMTFVAAQKRQLGMVFQKPLLFPHMNVEENIAFGLKMKKLSKQDQKKQVREILEVVGLKGFEQRFPHELSGGQQQRVAIARAVVIKPKMLLMDEPFSALDPSLREEMRRFILKIHKMYEMSILFVTHDREEAFMLFDRMALMKDGKIVQIDTPKKMYEKPHNVYSAEFLGCKNIFYGTLKNNIFTNQHLKMTGIEGKKEGMGWMVLRPETLQIIKNEETSSKSFEGIVRERLFSQGFVKIIAQVKDERVEITQNDSLGKEMKIGDRIRVSYQPKYCFWIPK